MKNALQLALTKGMVALVDHDDFHLVSEYNWYAHKGGSGVYAATTVTELDGKRLMIRMHRLILGTTDSKIYVDHINGDGLDNRRSNLRVCSHADNVKNRRNQQNNQSGFKGVSWHTTNKRWQAQIRSNGKRTHLGYYSSPQDAHAAYCDAAKKYHGAFSCFG